MDIVIVINILLKVGLFEDRQQPAVVLLAEGICLLQRGRLHFVSSPKSGNVIWKDVAGIFICMLCLKIVSRHRNNDILQERICLYYPMMVDDIFIHIPSAHEKIFHSLYRTHTWTEQKVILSGTQLHFIYQPVILRGSKKNT